ncbi:MAG: hypothetical protein LBT01_06650 [Spirochaetaceae bacterium]|jgi:hypothetical protein|nr:hypothetical protein [Spirochaetaceae bacterium]
MEPDKFGNVSFGELTKLLVGIIGQDTIFSLIPKKEHPEFKKKLSRAYKDEVLFRRLSTDEKENPQDYLKTFFDSLESKFNIPKTLIDGKEANFTLFLADSLTWQLFHGCLSYTPYEKTQINTVKYLLRKEIFHLINALIEKIYLSKDQIMKFLAKITDPNAYQETFNEAAKIISNGNERVLYNEITGFLIRNSKEFHESTLSMQMIRQWDNGKNIKWSRLEPILKYFHNDKQSVIVYRLIAIFLIRNTKKTFNELNLLANDEFEKITVDVINMLISNRNPEEFYDTTFGYDDSIKYNFLIAKCLFYFNQTASKSPESESLIKEIEIKLPNSKKFFLPWLRAKELVSSLDGSNNVCRKIQEYYKTAFDEGKYYAGCFLLRFLLEAILVENMFGKRRIKDLHDYHAFGYALEIFVKDINVLLKSFNDIKHLPLIHQFNIIDEFCNLLWDDPMIQMPYIRCPIEQLLTNFLRIRK